MSVHEHPECGRAILTRMGEKLPSFKYLDRFRPWWCQFFTKIQSGANVKLLAFRQNYENLREAFLAYNPQFTCYEWPATADDWFRMLGPMARCSGGANGRKCDKKECAIDISSSVIQEYFLL